MCYIRRRDFIMATANDAFLPGSLCNDELEDLLDLLHDRGVKVVDSQETTNFEEEELVEQEKQDEDEDEKTRRHYSGIFPLYGRYYDTYKR